MRTPRHKKARIHDLRTLRALYQGLQQLETGFFPSGAHYQAISRVTEAARHCAVVWSGDEGAFTINENVCFRRYGSENPFPGPLSKDKREAPGFVEPPLTVGAARSVLNAHPDVGCAEHRPIRGALNSLPADMTSEQLFAVWLRIAELFEDLSLVGLQAVRAKLDGAEGPDSASAAYWFTTGVYRHAILCTTPEAGDLSKLDGLAST